MENKELQGVLFPNTKQNEKSPDLRGSVKVGGVDYEISAWKRVSKAGNKYLSLALQVKDGWKKKSTEPTHTVQEQVQQVAQAVGGPETITNQGTDEDVPF